MSEPKPKLHNLRSKIAEYHAKYPKLWLTLKEGGPYRWETEDWKKEYPNSRLPGVYAFLNDADEVLYIGSSMQRVGMGKRIQARSTPDASGYLHTDRQTGHGMLHLDKQKSWKASLPTYLMTWAVLPEYVFFEAPALEAFLLHELQPRHNTQIPWK